MSTKIIKNKLSLASNNPNIVGLENKKQKLLSCNGNLKGNSLVNLCKKNTTILNDKTTMTFCAKTGKQLLVYKNVNQYK